MAEKVTVKRSGPLVKAWIDDKPLRFGPDDTASRDCTKGQHSLMWTVRGAPGTDFSLKITSPAKLAKTAVSGTIDSSMRDGGLLWFEI